MDQFFHIRIIIGMIMGLGITHLLKGIVKFAEPLEREKAYWLHLLWVFYLFLFIAHFWWWQFGLRNIPEWDVLDYFYIIIYTGFLFADAALLFPDSIASYQNYEGYFFARRKWIFSALAVTFALDIVDTLLKGSSRAQDLGAEYYASTAVHIIGCLVAIRIRNKSF